MEIFVVESVDGRKDAQPHGRRLDYHTISSPVSLRLRSGELKSYMNQNLSDTRVEDIIIFQR